VTARRDDDILPTVAAEERHRRRPGAGLCHSGQCASVNALMSYVHRPQDGFLRCEAEKVAFCGPSALRRFAYTHRYLKHVTA
jgi:hypothetical protein